MAQLISTLLLVSLRAVLRSHVGDPLSKDFPLTEGFEASHLASHIHQVEGLMIPLGVWNGPSHPPCADCHRAIEDNNSEPLSSKELIPFKNSDSVLPSRGDEAYIRAYRVLMSQISLQEFQPGSKEIDEMATKVYGAMQRIMPLLNLGGTWTTLQTILFKGAGAFVRPRPGESPNKSLEGLLKLRIGCFDPKIRVSFSDEAERQRKIIQALLSLTMYFHSQSRNDCAFESHEFLFVVGGCQADSESEPVFKAKVKAKVKAKEVNIKKVLSKEVFIFVDYLGVWFRGSDGRLSGASPGIINFTGSKTVFGLSHADSAYSHAAYVPHAHPLPSIQTERK